MVLGQFPPGKITNPPPTPGPGQLPLPHKNSPQRVPMSNENCGLFTSTVIKESFYQKLFSRLQLRSEK